MTCPFWYRLLANKHPFAINPIASDAINRNVYLDRWLVPGACRTLSTIRPVQAQLIDLGAHIAALMTLGRIPREIVPETARYRAGARVRIPRQSAICPG